MYVGTLVEAMYYDHEIIFNEDVDEEQKGWDSVYWDTAKKHVESKGGTLHHDPSQNGSMFHIYTGTNLDKVDPSELNKDLASAFHEYEKKQVPSNFIQRMIHKLRMLYNKWLHKANSEKEAGNIGFFKNILRILTNWIDKFLALLSGRRTAVGVDGFKAARKTSDKIKNTPQTHFNFNL